MRHGRRRRRRRLVSAGAADGAASWANHVILYVMQMKAIPILMFGMK